MVECTPENCLPIRPSKPFTVLSEDKQSQRAMNGICSSSSAPSEVSTTEEERGFRKKSREKIRRQEVKIRVR